MKQKKKSQMRKTKELPKGGSSNKNKIIKEPQALRRKTYWVGRVEI